jgi:hypothetical protein
MDVQELDEVRAKAFILLDDDGTERAVLRAFSPGLIGLQIMGAENDEPLISIGVCEGGNTPYVMVQRVDAQGNEDGTVWLSVDDGRPYVLLVDADGTVRNLTT